MLESFKVLVGEALFFRIKIIPHTHEVFLSTMADSSSEDDLIRFVVVGEDGSGKSSLLHTFLHDEFPEGICTSTQPDVSKANTAVPLLALTRFVVKWVTTL